VLTQWSAFLTSGLVLCTDDTGCRWTFRHRRGNANVENLRYPEAAVAYHEAFMTELVTNCGFREVTVRRGTPSELVARK
jgi:hypothetical protein